MSLLPVSATRRARPEPTVQYLSFRLRQEWFALPLALIQKVVVLTEISADSTARGIGLVRVEGRELVVVDVGRLLFRFTAAATEESMERYLLILAGGEDLGLPIDSRPMLRRLPATAFAALPSTYSTFAEIRYISSRAVLAEGEPPLFLLDAPRLLEALTSLNR